MSEFIHRDEPALCKVCSDKLYEAWRKRHAACMVCKAEHACACGGLEERKRKHRVLERELQMKEVGE